MSTCTMVLSNSVIPGSNVEFWAGKCKWRVEQKPGATNRKNHTDTVSKLTKNVVTSYCNFIKTATQTLSTQDGVGNDDRHLRTKTQLGKEKKRKHKVQII